MLFQKSFLGRLAPQCRRAPPFKRCIGEVLALIAVCVAEPVPVASGAWHGLVSVKVLAR